MADSLVERYGVVDADSHVIEPADLWTSRVSAKYGDRVPRPVFSDERQELVWLVGDTPLYGIGTFAMAGWSEFLPGHPPTLEDADKASWDPHARLQRMDEYGIRAQVLYPNLVGFFIGAFVKLNEPQLLLDCVRAYNDFIAEWCAADADRLYPIMMLPYWDLEASLREMDRCSALGHRGIVAAGRLSGVGLPPLRDQHWDPIWAAAAERGLPVNFHIGFSADPDSGDTRPGAFSRADFAETTSQAFMANMRTLAEVICSGIPHRFPELKIVSVESGAGWLPFFLESLDWQWLNTGVRQDLPGRELPSTYFWRQVWATFWFESGSLQRNSDLLQDNLMFSTDFPHPTSQSPGPASYARNPRDYVDDVLGQVSPSVAQKLLQDNALRVYSAR